MNCLSPVAALAAGIEHQADSTVLGIGTSLATIIEAVLVGWIGVEPVSFASAEAGSCAAATAATAASTAASRLGNNSLCWCNWRQGDSARTAGWRER